MAYAYMRPLFMLYVLMIAYVMWRRRCDGRDSLVKKFESRRPIPISDNGANQRFYRARVNRRLYSRPSIAHSHFQIIHNVPAL